jgi:predicted alpha/beta superfamily hydrolase
MKFKRSLRIGLLSGLLLCLVVFKFYGRPNVFAGDAGSPVHVHSLTGNIHLHTNFHSKFLPSSRDIIVYLPPNYDTDQTSRYPVLYMQDGQVIFDAATSFFPGKERHMDERAQELIGEHKIRPLIIVGIYSSALARVNEFTPQTATQPGRADLYGRMLVEEIKPFIESQYRVLSGRSNTALGGASMGGAVTMYLGIKYAHIFGGLAITSPAAFRDNEMIVRYVQSLSRKTNQRICLSIGTEEPSPFMNSTRDLRQALIAKGWREDEDFSYIEAFGSQHSPDERAVRVDHLLKFLFPVTRTKTN